MEKRNYLKDLLKWLIDTGKKVTFINRDTGEEVKYHKDERQSSSNSSSGNRRT